MVAATRGAYDLMHQGAIALSQVEANGIRIDTDYLERACRKGDRRIRELTEKLRDDDDVFPRWRRRFGSKVNLDSTEQLGTILFGEMGYEGQETESSSEEKTKYKTDETALLAVDHPFVELFMNRRKVMKARNTFLEGIRREVVDGFLHAVFNLHIAQTYRSSSNDPNFQNLPIRDPNMGKLIRRCFIPRDGHQLVEIDYSGVEVCIAACYHKDPNMISYIHDPTKDMHRDMAAQCYMVDPSEVSKGMRYCGKNMFVFPEFYGSYFMNCAPDMWEAILKMDLRTVSGEPVGDVLNRKGITGLGKKESDYSTGRIKTTKGTFIDHIRLVEDDFWNRRFKVYGKWKKDWWDQYQRRGYIQMKTGFVVDSMMNRKECINYPVQGAAFHCLLWSLIRVVKRIKKRKMKAKVVGQIHDSIVADVPENEVDDFLVMCREIMTEELLKAWQWIIVQLSIEAEVAPLGGSWADKREVAIP